MLHRTQGCARDPPSDFEIQLILHAAKPAKSTGPQTQADNLKAWADSFATFSMSMALMVVVFACLVVNDTQPGMSAPNVVIGVIHFVFIMESIGRFAAHGLSVVNGAFPHYFCACKTSPDPLCRVTEAPPVP